METEDVIDLPPSGNSGSESRNGEIQNCGFEPSAAAVSQPSNLEDDENMLDGEIPGTGEADVGNGEGQLLPEKDTEQDLIGSSSILEISAEVKESFSVAEDIDGLSSRLQAENGCVNVQDGSPIGRQKRDESPVSTSVSGVKKARIMVNEQQPSVLVTFNFLTRNSKRKLEELLQHWSEWHAQHCSLSHDSSEVLESGEETYFPALRFSLNNSSAVSFWMDNKPRNHDNKEIIPSDSYSIPLYDRGYLWALTSTDSSSNLEGGLEMVDSSRCFNCGAYNHTLKECPKPRDNVAVNNARKQHQFKRNQNASSRNPTRYYQNSAGGKYDGLRPGVLDAETQALLGLGELDPPPWLNRMREIGYPPGYLDPNDEEQPSGITIFGDEERKEETEDGEILDTDYPEAPRKMSVQFPGINAPIPENADERRWSAGPSSSEFSRNRLHNRVNHSSQTTHHDQKWSRDYRDQGPPGCDPRFNPTLSRYSSRYDDYDFSCSSWRERGNFPIPMSPSLERSSSDRGRWSPSVHDDSPKPGSYNLSPYSPPNRLFSSPSYGSGSSRKWDDDSRYEDPYYSSHHRDRDDKHRHHRRR